MWQSLRATTREGLREIHGALHDCRIDMESARFDSTTRTLSLDLELGWFEEAKSVWNLVLVFKRRIPVRAAVLTIHGVERFTVEDGARIGMQNVRNVTADPASRRMRIEMCQDGDIFADVDSIDVRVEVDDEIVRWSDVVYVLFCERSEF